MSRQSRLGKSRDCWRQKAGQRGEVIRYLRKELIRVKKERNGFKNEFKDTKLRLCQLEAQSRVPVVQHKVDLVLLALELFLVARIGFRAVSRVLGVLAGALGITKTPCPQTVINWVTRLSLVRIQSASVSKSLPAERAPFSNGLIWMIDASIALGTGKILTVLALDAHHHQLMPDAPGFQNVRCIAVSVADSWTGETVAALLKRLIAVMGPPTAYLKDGGSDLDKAMRILAEQKLGSPSIDDISHVIANILKYWYGDHPMFETFVSACGRVSGKVKQTILACLAPPKVHTKARFMNIHRLIAWAEKLLKLSPPGGAKIGSTLSKLRACLDRLPSCKTFIKQFQADAGPLLACQKILKTKGLSRTTLEQCKPIITTIPSCGVRRDFLAYLHNQLHTATVLGLEQIGMPISSDQIESLFGLAKQHGTGEIKDANRIAMRLPALCGIPTRLEAQQVLDISVADQYEMTGRLTSLSKQRREVLPDPSRLKSLGTDQTWAHITLIPDVKNRAKNQEEADQSQFYKEQPDPVPRCQSG